MGPFVSLYPVEIAESYFCETKRLRASVNFRVSVSVSKKELDVMLANTIPISSSQIITNDAQS